MGCQLSFRIAAACKHRGSGRLLPCQRRCIALVASVLLLFGFVCVPSCCLCFCEIPSGFASSEIYQHHARTDSSSVNICQALGALTVPTHPCPSQARNDWEHLRWSE